MTAIARTQGELEHARCQWDRAVRRARAAVKQQLREDARELSERFGVQEITVRVWGERAAGRCHPNDLGKVLDVARGDFENLWVDGVPGDAQAPSAAHQEAMRRLCALPDGWVDLVATNQSFGYFLYLRIRPTRLRWQGVPTPPRDLKPSS